LDSDGQLLLPLSQESPMHYQSCYDEAFQWARFLHEQAISTLSYQFRSLEKDLGFSFAQSKKLAQSLNEKEENIRNWVSQLEAAHLWNSSSGLGRLNAFVFFLTHVKILLNVADYRLLVKAFVNPETSSSLLILALAEARSEQDRLQAYREILDNPNEKAIYIWKAELHQRVSRDVESSYQNTNNPLNPAPTSFLFYSYTKMFFSNYTWPLHRMLAWFVETAWQWLIVLTFFLFYPSYFLDTKSNV
jgi:hypothetical protein